MGRPDWQDEPARPVIPPAMPAVGPSSTSRPIPAPDTIEYTDKMVEDVCNAWTEPGPHYRYHRECQEWLELHWPTLATAVKNLVKGTQ
jgi:hypothetical protein